MLRKRSKILKKEFNYLVRSKRWVTQLSMKSFKHVFPETIFSKSAPMALEHYYTDASEILVLLHNNIIFVWQTANDFFLINAITTLFAVKNAILY